MGSSIFLIAIFAFFVFLSFLFAGSETGMYQLSRVRLRLGVEKKRFSFILLGRIMGDSAGLLLSTLVGNNLTNYLATSAVTYLFFTKVGPESAEALATLATVPVLFVFAELIPKNLFFYRADFLMPRVAPLLYVFHKAFTWCGAVPVLRSVARLFSRLIGMESSSKSIITSAQRHRIRAILQDTHEEGVLSSVQRDMIDRIVGIPTLRIRSVMVPMNMVQMIDVSSDRAALLEKLRSCSFTRWVVYEGQKANIVGFVNIYEVLSSSDDFDDLRELIKPFRRLRDDTVVTDAIDIMQREGQKIMLVTRAGRAKRGKYIGIVTMKDLAEELLGELAEW
ncbi:MAG: CNNM domain-containing protein [Planctomycetota bacterium]|jgi:CBS domain containing-hemolysin-like protein